MQTQPRFSVVTFVLVALTALAFLSKVLAPYVVAPTNRLSGAQATFLQSGSHEHVAWYSVSDYSFQEARRLDRPILLVVGAPWSQTGRRMDSTVFNSVQVQKLLDRNFICIRVDSVESPDWMAAYLPITRAQVGIPGDFQIWILDPQGRLFTPLSADSRTHLFAPLAANAQDPGYGDTQFMDELLASLAKLQEMRNSAGPTESFSADASSLQSADLSRLVTTPQNLVPNLASYRSGLLVRSGESPSGGFPVSQRQRLWPDAWMFLLASSGADATAPSVQGLLASPTRDMLDGGFFYGSRDLLWEQPSFDKVAVLNAEMCLLLAQFAASDPSAVPYARFADETFDSLAGEFLGSDGLIRPCRIGDERAGGPRSQHSSFTPRRLRSLLDGVERDWAQEYLHLRPSTNPAMTPYLTSFELLDSPMFNRVVPKLKGAAPLPVFDAETTLGSCGSSVARLIQAARLLNDPVRLQRAHDIANRIDVFHRGRDVVHELTPSERGKPTLPDYLGFADAELQNFLGSSRVVSLEDGATVLKRGLELFAIPGQAGYCTTTHDSPHLRAPESDPPQICDDTGESANAAVVRLAWTYSQLLDHSGKVTDRQLAADLRTRATAVVTQFADLAAEMGPYTGGYALASALTTDDTFLLCSGPDPVAMANALAPKSPFRMVVPVAGPVYPELLRKPGYYLSRHGQLFGPMNEDAVLKLLPSTLNIGG